MLHREMDLGGQPASRAPETVVVRLDLNAAGRLLHIPGGEQVASDSFVMSAGSGSGRGKTWWYSPSTLKGNTTGYVEYYICKYSGGFNSSCTTKYSIRFDIS
ncbi:hypothetical protein ACFH04_41845 [Streptomyces noboritoensis]|uniref:Uncharacterized protein n=1 Tax=Streptomyces noboritoensis TaxID=67337 RepID=A0ABV6TCY2_9ACTN